MKGQQKYHLPIGKRVFDVVISLSVLIVLLPLFLIVALAIRLESKGPIFYSSKRVGAGYRVFNCYKFRSMYSGADRKIAELEKLNQYAISLENKIDPKDENIELVSSSIMLVGDNEQISEYELLRANHKKEAKVFVKLAADPRVTRIGRIIRKYSIDELPQLFNILKGDMSVVGNRPLPLYEAEKLTSDDSVERFMAPAGLTGLWQVERRGSYDMSSAERKMLDTKYAREFGPLMDLRIIIRTFTSFIQKEDV